MENLNDGISIFCEFASRLDRNFWPDERVEIVSAILLAYSGRKKIAWQANYAKPLYRCLAWRISVEGKEWPMASIFQVCVSVMLKYHQSLQKSVSKDLSHLTKKWHKWWEGEWRCYVSLEWCLFCFYGMSGVQGEELGLVLCCFQASNPFPVSACKQPKDS